MVLFQGKDLLEMMICESLLCFTNLPVLMRLPSEMNRYDWKMISIRLSGYCWLDFLLENFTAFLLPQYYRVCHGFRLMKWDDYFWVKFDDFLRRLEQSWKFAWSYNQTTIRKFSWPKSLKHTVTWHKYIALNKSEFYWEKTDNINKRKYKDKNYK